MKASTGSNKVSGHYHSIFIYRLPLLYDLTANLFGMKKGWRRVTELAEVRSGERVLDVCCGTGGLTSLLAEKTGEGGEVRGIDLSPRMLARARRKAKSSAVTFSEANAEDIPCADDYFDKATVSMALHEMPLSSRENSLREMRRVTRRGGRVVILEPYQYNNPVGRLIVRLFEPSTFFQMEGLVGEAEGSGLRVLQHERLEGNRLQIIVAESGDGA